MSQIREEIRRAVAAHLESRQKPDPGFARDVLERMRERSDDDQDARLPVVLRTVGALGLAAVLVVAGMRFAHPGSPTGANRFSSGAVTLHPSPTWVATTQITPTPFPSPNPEPTAPVLPTPSAGPLNGPVNRTDAGVAWDDKDGYLLLFGGSYDSGSPSGYSDTWKWDGARWTRLNTATAPPAGSATLAYDPISRRVVALVSGAAPFDHSASPSPGVSYPYPSPDPGTQTWAWDGSTWTRLSTSVTPAFGFRDPQLVLDPRLGRLVLIVIPEPGNVMAWSWTGTDWAPINAPSPPAGHDMACAAYDPDLGAIVVGAGTDPGLINPTWTFDGVHWTRLPGPGPTDGGSAPCQEFYDASTHRLLLYSEMSQTMSALDTNGSWSRLDPPDLPSGMSTSTAAHDARNRPVMLFSLPVMSGLPGSGALEIWAWTGSGWVMA